jgi:hypothetical protein
MAREDLIELLRDLRHDLGKYIRLPLAMLPREAGDEEVRSALRQALQATRRGPAGDVPARAIWQQFLEQCRGNLPLPSWPRLCEAVGEALALEGQLDPPTLLRPPGHEGQAARSSLRSSLAPPPRGEAVGRPDRALIEGTLAAVTVAITELIEEARDAEETANSRD